MNNEVSLNDFQVAAGIAFKYIAYQVISKLESKPTTDDNKKLCLSFGHARDAVIKHGGLTPDAKSDALEGLPITIKEPIIKAHHEAEMRASNLDAGYQIL